VDVPVWAYGPGATHFRGAYHLSELGRRIAMLAATPIGQRAAAPLGGGE
jgi:alkaline phosphatase